MMINRKGEEVKAGDIVWHQGESFSLISWDEDAACLKTTDDRRLFVWIPLSVLGWRAV